MGVGEGPTGNAYALPTKDKYLRTLSFAQVRLSVKQFLCAASADPVCKFFVTRVGCGLAGYTDAEIAPLFRDAPPNCSFAEDWRKYLEDPPESPPSNGGSEG